MIKKMKETKAPTKGELEKRIKSSVVFVPKDKETETVYFDDKGLRLTVTMDFAIIETGYHRHVFNMITANGISKPYIYTQRFVDIALKNDCTTTDAQGNITRSYSKLITMLKEKEDRTEYNIAWFCDLWFFNIFAPLYELDETEAGAFLVYERYIHNIARQVAILDEHKEDVTNKVFVDKVIASEQELLAEITENVIFKARTDEQFIEDEVAAMQEQELEQAVKEGN